MNDIAQASQKGRRTMYTYFSSKEDIYYAVIEDELEHLSEEMDKVVNLPIDPQEKIVKIIYTHLHLIEDVVKRNGSLRAEFFSDIHMSISLPTSSTMPLRASKFLSCSTV